MGRVRRAQRRWPSPATTRAKARSTSGCAIPSARALTLDEFVEAIPYDETRGYTKRVLASFFAYSWLYDGNGAVPPLPLRDAAAPVKHK